MSSCDRCGGNPCRCCEHHIPPGTCADCANDEITELRIRIEEIESTYLSRHELIKIFQELRDEDKAENARFHPAGVNLRILRKLEGK